MSPFFRGSVRPPRKHPRPWSLNPRLNPDIAKDGVVAREGNTATAGAPAAIPRASIYGVGAHTEEITLPVHNGVYTYDRRAGADTAAVIAEKEEEAAIGVETPVVVNVFGSTSAVAETETETDQVKEVEEVEDTKKIDNSSPLHTGSIGTAVGTEKSGLESRVIPEEKEEDKEWPLTSEAIDNKALPDGKPKAANVEPSEAVVLENPEEPTKEAVKDEVIATPPAPPGVETTETGETATEVRARSVVAENTVNPGESSEIASSTPLTETNAAAPLEVELAKTIAPHSAEPVTAETLGGGAGSSTVELPPVEADEMKAVPIQPSSAVEAELEGVEDETMAVAEAAPAEEVFQPKEEEEAPAVIEDAAPASKATVEVAAQTNEVSSAVAMDRTLTPPPEAHNRIADSESGAEDDESAAEAPFIPDHRHTPPSSRKPSRGEDAAIAVDDQVQQMDEPQPLKDLCVKDVPNNAHVEPAASVEGSIANEEPLISDEQLNVSDEFRPDVKM